MATAEEIDPRVFARSAQVASGLVRFSRRLDLGEQPGAEEEGELTGIATIRLHTFSGLGRDQRRRHHHAACFAPSDDLALQRVATRTRFVAEPHLARRLPFDAP